MRRTPPIDDDAFANLSDFERSEQLLLLRVELFFENQPLREHDAMTLVIEIDHLQAQALSDQLVEIADGLTANLRCGNESAHAEIDEYAAFDDLRDRCFDHFVLLVRFNDFLPRLERACAPFGEKQLAIIIDAMNHHFELVADLERLRIDRETQLAERKRAFRLASDVDQQFFLILGDDDAGQDLTLVEDFQALFVEPLLEGELVFFSYRRFRRSDFSCRDLFVPINITTVSREPRKSPDPSSSRTRWTPSGPGTSKVVESRSQ